jgi:hypothetical protein
MTGFLLNCQHLPEDGEQNKPSVPWDTKECWSLVLTCRNDTGFTPTSVYVHSIYNKSLAPLPPVRIVKKRVRTLFVSGFAFLYLLRLFSGFCCLSSCKEMRNRHEFTTTQIKVKYPGVIYVSWQKRYSGNFRPAVVNCECVLICLTVALWCVGGVELAWRICE